MNQVSYVLYYEILEFLVGSKTRLFQIVWERYWMIPRRFSNFGRSCLNQMSKFSKSYRNVMTSLDDRLIIVKLPFFSYVAGIVKPFLMQFQIDKLMIPYLFFELKTIVTHLLKITVQPEVIESCKSARQLKEIDLIYKTKIATCSQN